MPAGVVGDETQLNQRVLFDDTHASVLTGDFATPLDDTDSSYRVLRGNVGDS